MIYEKSVHTVNFLFLCIKFIRLCSEWFAVECPLLCIKGNHLELNFVKVVLRRYREGVLLHSMLTMSALCRGQTLMCQSVS